MYIELALWHHFSIENYISHMNQTHLFKCQQMSKHGNKNIETHWEQYCCFQLLIYSEVIFCYNLGFYKKLFSYRLCKFTGNPKVIVETLQKPATQQLD